MKDGMLFPMKLSILIVQFQIMLMNRLVNVIRFQLRPGKGLNGCPKLTISSDFLILDYL